MYTKQDSAIILIGVVGSRTTTDSTHTVGYQICTARGLNVSVNLTVKRNPTETFSDTYKLRIQIVTLLHCTTNAAGVLFASCPTRDLARSAT